jgi:hypothetical protein
MLSVLTPVPYFINVDDMFILTAIKFYEINLEQKNRRQLPQIVGAFNYNPIGSEFHCDISDIPNMDYKKLFDNFEQRGDGGFPIF